MHISLTPELEEIVKRKVQSGLYNNASEVIREALRFLEAHEELIYQMKLERLRSHLAEGERDIDAGRFTEIGQQDIEPFFQKVKDRALGKAD
jgi:antitoxin ParD1/3/4